MMNALLQSVKLVIKREPCMHSQPQFSLIEAVDVVGGTLLGTAAFLLPVTSPQIQNVLGITTIPNRSAAATFTKPH